MKLLHYCLLFITLFINGSAFSQTRPVCDETDNNVKQIINTYIYLTRNNPIHFLKGLDAQTFEFPALRLFKEALEKTNTPGSETNLFFAFNEEQFQLQGNAPGQSATVSDESSSNQKWPRSAAFTISNSPHFSAQTILVLSGGKALGLRVLTIDNCLHTKLLFDSQILANSDRPLPYGSFEMPIRRVAIGSKGRILLYEEGKEKPYDLQAVMRAFGAIKNKQKQKSNWNYYLFLQFPS